MKKLFLLLFAFLSFGLLAQIPGTPDASGVITAGPPWVTGTNTGKGELQKQFTYLNIVRSNTVKAHITSKIDVAGINAWQNFTGFILVEPESSGDYLEPLNDSTLLCLVAGIYQFGGCVHVQNNTGVGFEDITVLTRLLKNSTTEARCSQRGYTKTIRAGGEDVLSYNGSDYLDINDTLRLQYWTDNIDLDFNSNAAFTDQIAASIWLTYIGIKQ